MKHAHRGVTWCMYHTTQIIQARIKKLTYLNCLLFLLSFLLLSFQHFIKLLLMSSVHLSSDSVSFLQAQQSQQTQSANITTSLQRYQLTAYIQTLLTDSSQLLLLLSKGNYLWLYANSPQSRLNHCQVI